MEIIKSLISQSIATKEKLLQSEQLIQEIDNISKLITQSFEQGHQLLFCGNGGSAADAQHLAAEFSGRFYSDREPLPAEALHCNSSYMTAVANDYGFEHVYCRMIKAIGKKGDVLIAISTSGNSVNIINALEQAQKMGLHTIGFSGESGGKMKALCQYLINIPSQDTPRIQEAHIMVGHIICQIVEENIFKNK